MAHMYTHNAQIYTYALSNVITVLSANIGNSQKKWARPHLIPERSLSIPILKYLTEILTNTPHTKDNIKTTLLYIDTFFVLLQRENGGPN